MRTMRNRAFRVAEALRRAIPLPLVPLVVWVRYRLRWAQPAVREDARRQMRFLLEAARPEADLEAAARAYVKRMVQRGELRWHPETFMHQRVEGFEHLEKALTHGRGVVLNYMHFGFYEGLSPSLAARGVRQHMLGFDHILGDDAPGWLKQNIATASTGGNIPVSVAIGSQGIADLLREGKVVTFACDIPGQTPVRFVGRDLVGSFGAARVPTLTDSPVVVATNEIDEDGKPLLRLHPPLVPADFASPRDLLERMLEIHEPVVLRWPEQSEIPLSRWGQVPGKQAAETFR